jgi:hypothetical protein
MRNCTPKLLAVFLGLCLCASAFAIDVPLKYQKHPEESESFFPYGNVVFEKKLEPPPGEWKFPEFVSKSPLYAVVKFGNTERLCVLDKQKDDSKFLDRMYFDANGNKDLTDDPSIDGTVDQGPNERYLYVNYPSMDVKIEVDDKSLPYSFRPRIFVYMLEQLEKQGFNEKNINRFVQMIFMVNCSYTGEFEIGGQKYKVFLGDSNGNGRFNDRFSVYKFERPPPGRIRVFGQGDSFYITTGDKIEVYDVHTLGDMLLVKDKLFKVKISTAEGELTLTPVTGKLVPLQLDMETQRISLYTEDEKHCIMAFQSGKKIKVPAGKYRLYNYQLFKKDEQGDLWRLNASATNESPFVTVDGRGKPTIGFGEPFKPLVEVRMRGKTSRASIGFDIEGKGKEFVTDLSHVFGDRTKILLSEEENLSHRPKEPTYKVVKADGEVVAQGSFEYG